MGNTSRESERGRGKIFIQVTYSLCFSLARSQGLAISLYQGPLLLWDLLYLLVVPPPFALQASSAHGSPPLWYPWVIAISLASFIKLCLYCWTESLLGVFCFFLLDLSCHIPPSVGFPPGSLHAGFIFFLSFSSDATPTGRPSLTTHHLHSPLHLASCPLLFNTTYFLFVALQ